MWHYNIRGEILNIRPQVFLAPVVKLRFKLFMPGVAIFLGAVFGRRHNKNSDEKKDCFVWGLKISPWGFSSKNFYYSASKEHLIALTELLSG